MDLKLMYLLLLTCNAIQTQKWVQSIDEGLEHLNAAGNKLENMLKIFAEQVQRQQSYEQQQIRSAGNSGLKRIRDRHIGLKNYHQESHNGFSVAAIHDHANYVRTVGMGEIQAVLNGVEFQTKHNDYILHKPANNTNLHETEEIPFPDVPPSVTGTVVEQIAEMREWFLAFNEQNHTKRDYRKYFKPVLCYLEGAWMNSGEIDYELQDQIKFAAYAGTKNGSENLAWLPTSIFGFNNSVPIFAQFNYRTLCQPLSRDLPLNRLRVKNDLSSMSMTGRSIYRHLFSRAARFVLNQKDSDEWFSGPTGFKANGDIDVNTDPRGLLDLLMSEIPGKDNYPGNLKDEGLDRHKTTVADPANTAYYHRWIKTTDVDESRSYYKLRGFSDSYMFCAQTTQSKVSGRSVCKRKDWRKKCVQLLDQKWSYAIPLEIIYLTPLSKWNPYGLINRGDSVTENGRTGVCTTDKSKAFNGVNSKNYYLTPKEFFTGTQIDNDPADTVRKADTCVLDQNNNTRIVKASGIHILLPEIKGVGIIRQRYPIMPIHGEGSPFWKELNALKHYYTHMIEEEVKALKWIETYGFHREIVLEVRASNARTGHHVHRTTLVTTDIRMMKAGMRVSKITSRSHGHTHYIIIRWKPLQKWFYMEYCDRYWKCRLDDHSRVLRIVSIDGVSFDRPLG